MLGKLTYALGLNPISRPEPQYPAAALAAHVRGTVEMRALIGTDGRIVALNVIRGPAELQQAALDAVWKWWFEPPLVNSGPAQILTEFAIRF